jgi:predicted nucleic acid-binding protein
VRSTQRGLIDTSVLTSLESIDPDKLPDELTISAVTLAEIAAGPHATNDRAERARRQERRTGRRQKAERRSRRAGSLLHA